MSCGVVCTARQLHRAGRDRADECAGRFVPEHADTATLGSAAQLGTTLNPFEWSDRAAYPVVSSNILDCSMLSPACLLPTATSAYPTGSYAVDIPIADAERRYQLVHDLLATRWISNGLRAVAIDVAMYSAQFERLAFIQVPPYPNISVFNKLICVVWQLVVEFTNEAIAMPSVHIEAFAVHGAGNRRPPKCLRSFYILFYFLEQRTSSPSLSLSGWRGHSSVESCCASSWLSVIYFGRTKLCVWEPP